MKEQYLNKKQQQINCQIIQSFINNFLKLNTASIEMLKDPVDFYVNLHKGIKRAEKNILLSTLYIGIGNMEEFLIKRLSNQQRKI
ncbi:unnamed protein product [Paramecium octaurelia]|uniref:CDP-diacylglycerol--glycerol-3-phosphate 3-phosphatidyltransferase n=1 Tax=Paramecium octaurelia TaxID=43137 RepID=A0A8S1UIN5_PAROT|nr:unnamed protein product [Paramecium octaurelia]